MPIDTSVLLIINNSMPPKANLLALSLGLLFYHYPLSLNTTTISTTNSTQYLSYSSWTREEPITLMLIYQNYQRNRYLQTWIFQRIISLKHHVCSAYICLKYHVFYYEHFCNFFITVIRKQKSNFYVFSKNALDITLVFCVLTHKHL